MFHYLVILKKKMNRVVCVARTTNMKWVMLFKKSKLSTWYQIAWI